MLVYWSVVQQSCHTNSWESKGTPPMPPLPQWLIVPYVSLPGCILQQKLTINQKLTWGHLRDEIQPNSAIWVEVPSSPNKPRNKQNQPTNINLKTNKQLELTFYFLGKNGQNCSKVKKTNPLTTWPYQSFNSHGERCVFAPTTRWAAGCGSKTWPPTTRFSTPTLHWCQQKPAEKDHELKAFKSELQ